MNLFYKMLLTLSVYVIHISCYKSYISNVIKSNVRLSKRNNTRNVSVDRVAHMAIDLVFNNINNYQKGRNVNVLDLYIMCIRT